MMELPQIGETRTTISLPKEAMSVLMAECERSTLQPGYARVPNSRQDTQGNVWVCMSRDEIKDPASGEIVQKRGIYLTQDIGHSSVAAAKEALHKCTKALAEAIQQRRHLASVDRFGAEQYLRDHPEAEDIRGEYVPVNSDAVAELDVKVDELKAEESRLKVLTQGETVTYWFPHDLAGVEFEVSR